ncbi:conjugal transfer protein [Streptomyces sp. NBC_01221]|uniref:hypothetical protein n=1 Tax=Streptomyces sp. NBC_01221 TaxID=2903782 RepID=UPI00224D7FA4|nr:hypothetical protein [Streptomyces sp. NBC_01221]MCX4792263.1 conjugal transfer protein [Streptomyces sp. NBC_01221]
MTAVLVEPAEPDGELIGRCYTKARRTPLVVGSVPGGAGRSLRLPGGPYTLTQLAAIVTTFVVLIVSRPLWGGHGLMDVVVLLGCPFGVAFLLRHLHIDGRNPAAAAASVAVMMTGPRWGRLHGRPFRPARPARGATRITVAADDVPADDDADVSAASAVPARTAPTQAARRPTPAPSAAANAPVASGVQALLARRAASARDDLEK